MLKSSEFKNKNNFIAPTTTITTPTTSMTKPRHLDLTAQMEDLEISALDDGISSMAPDSTMNASHAYR